ncbi:MAG: UvrD-helicase domain-containing protein [Planctomycetota bacterium]
MSPESLLEGLTDAQREAVAHTNGPLLVLAGPGSGKTRVITRRAAHIASTVARPDQVLAITFTNKAAGEMRSRIFDLGVGRGPYGPMWVCTFHALCARLLREYGHLFHLKENFSIFDDSDQRALLKEAVTSCRLSTDNWPPRMVQEAIGRAKNQIKTPGDLEAGAQDFTTKTVARIYAEYQKLLVAQNAVDFDDLLMYVARLLQDFADVRAALCDRFRYLLIDEYQDTNHAQYVIANQLASGHRNICATGDPDQSIYAWRGANIQNILDFESDYPDAKVVRLEENFRSTGLILSGASNLIAHNDKRKKKDLWTQSDSGEAVRVWTCEDERHEATLIAQDIRKHLDEGGRGGDIAIFYRVNALTRVLEDELRRLNIPYQIVRGVEFYNRKEIKDCLAYLRIMVNPADETAMLRAINTPPRGIGKTTIEKLKASALTHGVTLYETILSLIAPDAPVTSAAITKKLLPFAALLADLRDLPPRPVAPSVEAVLKKSGLENALALDTEIDNEPLENVRELVTAAKQYDMDNPDGSVGQWLQQISLTSDQDALTDMGGPVLLMTLHTAKGLEFPLVFIVGLEEGLLPHSRAITSGESDDLEEERRLCFVGMTRAQSLLTLTHAKYRMVRGITERTIVSRFIKELPKAELAHDIFEVEQDRSRSHLGRFNYDDDAPDTASDYYPGQRVRHAEYGDGEVLKLEPRGRTTYIRIHFAEHGERAFSLDHVPLYVID